MIKKEYAIDLRCFRYIIASLKKQSGCMLRKLRRIL